MSNDFDKVKDLFPIFNEIERAVLTLNTLLEKANEQGLSIKFVQASKTLLTPTGNSVQGPPEPKLHMTTFSWRRPND